MSHTRGRGVLGCERLASISIGKKKPAQKLIVVESCSLSQEVLYSQLDLVSSALQAEKAEGYINLTNFVIDRAIECKKKQ